VPVRFDKRVVASRIGFLAACAGMMAGCELENAGVPRVIPGPSVPSPVPLHAPYVWDTREELAVWTENAVSRGSFTIDSDDSNGAIAIRLAGASGTLLLRGPDVDPPAQAIRAVRIRYQWLPDSPTVPFTLWASFDVTNSPNPEFQPRASATLKTGPGWQEIELRNSSPLDLRYVYFGTYSTGMGLLKIDAITLVG